MLPINLVNFSQFYVNFNLHKYNLYNIIYMYFDMISFLLFIHHKYFIFRHSVFGPAGGCSCRRNCYAATEMFP